MRQQRTPGLARKEWGNPFLCRDHSWLSDQSRSMLALYVVHKSWKVLVMKYTKIKARIFLLSCLVWTGWISISKDAAAAEIDWQKYMQSSANVSAIAAAVAWVDDCSKKLKIEESISGRRVRLSFTCSGIENHGEHAVVEFDKIGDGGLVPKKFEFAG